MPFEASASKMQAIDYLRKIITVEYSSGVHYECIALRCIPVDDEVLEPPKLESRVRREL